MLCTRSQITLIISVFEMQGEIDTQRAFLLKKCYFVEQIPTLMFALILQFQPLQVKGQSLSVLFITILFTVLFVSHHYTHLNSNYNVNSFHVLSILILV